jgi:SAM-dependent methyltransferase
MTDERPLPRLDETPDDAFYRSPRFVTHIDDAAIRAVTAVYRERIPTGSRVLDLMSSWVSHLPTDLTYARVVGLGMNEAELRRNPQLSEYRVHDLNADPGLPFEDAAFDACTICVSIDYLTRPVTVLREVARVLTPGGVLVVTFSNRCFPTKAVLPWHGLSDAGHVELVSGWLREAGFVRVVSEDRSPRPGRSDPLYAVIGHSPA